MNQPRSGEIKRFTQRYGWLLPVTLLYSIAISFLFAGLGLMLVESAKFHVTPITFNVYGSENIYGSLRSQMMTHAFASDFKETNHYYFVYDEQQMPYIVQVHGDLSQKYLNIQSYLYDESVTVPRPVMFYGMSTRIEDNIRKFAMESYNELWGKDLVTENNFSDYFGEYYLDTTKKPKPPIPNIVYLFFLYSIVLVFVATFLLWVKKGRASLFGQNKEENDAMAALYGISAAVEIEYGNVLLGTVGGLFGAFIGVGLWVLMGQIGFIAGIAGLVMLKLSMSGYQRLGKVLDKKGALICIFITSGMILGANLLDYAISLARVYFQYEASFETLGYIFLNFFSLMSQVGMWNDFFLDLAIGYGLSVCSNAGVIKTILSLPN